MPYISYYPSPFGTICLSSDVIGLRELRFSGQRDFSKSELPDTPTIRDAKKWLDIYFSGQIPISPRHSTLWVHRSKWKCGKFCAPFPTASPPPTEKSPNKLPPSEAFLKCLPRPWAVLWGAIRSALSSPATVFLDLMAV